MGNEEKVEVMHAFRAAVDKSELLKDVQETWALMYNTRFWMSVWWK